MEIGHRIKRFREDAGMTQTELARAVGVSRGLVGQWESHRKKPGREILRRLAEATMTNAGALLGEQPNDAVANNHGELSLLRRYRHLSRRQQENLLELLGVSLDIRREIEKQAEPPEHEPAIA
jgi:transcriptional regulator with XRE-family HTH domain